MGSEWLAAPVGFGLHHIANADGVPYLRRLAQRVQPHAQRAQPAMRQRGRLPAPTRWRRAGLSLPPPSLSLLPPLLSPEECRRRFLCLRLRLRSASESELLDSSSLLLPLLLLSESAGGGGRGQQAGAGSSGGLSQAIQWVCSCSSRLGPTRRHCTCCTPALPTCDMQGVAFLPADLPEWRCFRFLCLRECL